MRLMSADGTYGRIPRPFDELGDEKGWPESRPQYPTEDPNVIKRDVAIIGGGSSGTYMAVQLKDAGKTFVVLEPKDQLGGHAETYIDPDTGIPIDIGVVVWENTTTVRDYFARLDVPLIDNAAISATNNATIPVDFSTGQIDASYPPPDQAAVGAALAGYAAQRAKYPALQAGFNLTYPVPEDLLLPFGEFVTKYQLEALVPIAFLVSQGITPYLNVSTLYVFKNFNPLQLSQPLLTTKNHNTHELYANALTELGSDVLLQTSVKEVRRSNGLVRLTVQTPEGPKTIEAKKVVFAAPPVLDNLTGWDLSEAETALFGQWHASGYYTGILEHAGIPAGFAQLQNSGPGKPFRLPELPGPYVFRQVDAANLTQVYYGSPDVVSVEDAKAEILANLARFKTANGIPAAAEPAWRTFSSHAPFNLMVSKEAIEDRFYEKVFALQGTRNTYYTGAAWTTQASNSIWEFTDQYLLPILLAAL
ncbi:amine oxidase- flavin-containing superfamily [Apiospora aurea]|uniref:Amine oxidase- flavin-containing superfamily n=1 Tax=Apiospora aurea TaxID=335848 RepID=A0ABR1Q1G9_9PEZI